MPATREPFSVKSLVEFPSAGALAYQAQVLIDQLRDFNDHDYPLEARSMRDVFLCIADYVAAQISEIAESSLYESGDARTLQRLRALAIINHKLYTQVKYLRGSLAIQSPPGIQLALSQLTKTYFPKQYGEPLCIVRPQWKYNLQYIPISNDLEDLLLSTSV